MKSSILFYFFTVNRASNFIVGGQNFTDKAALQAGYFLSRLEGIIPALESAHALAILEKIKFKKEEITVLILSGRGDKDLETYIKQYNAK